jgi:hypothetical protein
LALCPNARLKGLPVFIKTMLSLARQGAARYLLQPGHVGTSKAGVRIVTATFLEFTLSSSLYTAPVSHACACCPKTHSWVRLTQWHAPGWRTGDGWLASVYTGSVPLGHLVEAAPTVPASVTPCQLGAGDVMSRCMKSFNAALRTQGLATLPPSDNCESRQSGPLHFLSAQMPSNMTSAASAQQKQHSRWQGRRIQRVHDATGRTVGKRLWQTTGFQHEQTGRPSLFFEPPQRLGPVIGLSAVSPSLIMTTLNRHEARPL